MSGRGVQRNSARALLLAVLLGSGSAAAEDVAPSENVEAQDTRRRTKMIAAASIGAVHLAYATWSYFAWYRGADVEDFFVVKSDTMFDVNSYAGGADKLGHVWSNYSLTRGTTAILASAGWSRLQASLASAALTELAFTLTEIEDGYVYGFEPYDMASNLSGAALAILMENLPAVDRLLDYRVQYFPSKAYRYQLRTNGSVDVAQDYDGQSYLLSMHLGALPCADESEHLYWTRFVDISVGFEAVHYAPEPEMRVDAPKQTLYVGLSVNMQGVLNHVLPEWSGRRIGHGAFEVLALPYTTLRYAEASRSP
jgi:hypothetical protein